MFSRVESRTTRREKAIGLAYVLPYAVFLLCFGIAPSIYALFLSFHDQGGGLFRYGLSAYRFALADPNFHQATRNVVTFAAFVTPIMLVLVTVLALMLHSRARHAANAFRLVYFLPAAVSGSVVVLIWLFMLDPAGSPYRDILHAGGWNSFSQIVTRDNYFAIFGLMFLWSAMGGWIIITSAALKNVPDEVVGAAKIDGCGSLAMTLHIYLPLIKKTLLLMTILVLAAASQVYTEPAVLATFTADTVPWSLNELSYRLAFRDGFFEASAAVAMMLVGAAMAMACVIAWRFDLVRDEQA